MKLIFFNKANLIALPYLILIGKFQSVWSQIKNKRKTKLRNMQKLKSRNKLENLYSVRNFIVNPMSWTCSSLILFGLAR